MDKILRTTRPGGVTLAEMLVAISITILMLMITGMVFKSSSDASGKAIALNDLMLQTRVLTRQLEQDLEGLRSDMPMAIMFEAHCNNGTDPTYDPADSSTWLGVPYDKPRLVRYDRIVFFANGDFQASDYPDKNGYAFQIKSGLAQVFYGQSMDRPATPEETLWPIRQILTRRCRMLVNDDSSNPFFNWYKPSLAGTPGSPEEYDFMPVIYPIQNPDCSSPVVWKNIKIELFQDFLYNDYYREIYFSNYKNKYLHQSLIRRPYLGVDNQGPGIAGIRFDGLQRLYMLPDVVDFKIQLWFETIAGDYWFPTDQYLASNPAFGVYWNVNTPVTTSPPPPPPYDVDGIEWWPDHSLTQTPLSHLNAWPRAIRFTFTLYDRNRSHFPLGKTITYIKKLPPRDK
ncbi:MAG: type II secretion system protein [Sedimentisphaerales bacterium]|nr:type II secretion system protein [Sedimentisphaerales bacterium]